MQLGLSPGSKQELKGHRAGNNFLTMKFDVKMPSPSIPQDYPVGLPPDLSDVIV